MSKRRANGEGTLRKRSDGRWEGRYTAGYDLDAGKRIIKNVLGRIQAEAKVKLKVAVEQATADRYKVMIETYTIPRIGKINLEKLTSRDLQKMYKNLMEHGWVNQRSGHGTPDLSGTTVRSVHLMFHSAFERAMKKRLIPRPPPMTVLPRKYRRWKTLRPEQLKSYLEAADTRGILPMFYLELVSGLRKGELAVFLWDDLDIQNRTNSVSVQVHQKSQW